MCINNTCQGTCRRPCRRRIREQQDQGFTSLTFSALQEPARKDQPLPEVEVEVETLTLKLPSNQDTTEERLCA